MANPNSEALYSKCLEALRKGEGVTYSNGHYLYLDLPGLGEWRVNNYPDCYNSGVPVGTITEREHREVFLETRCSCLAISDRIGTEETSYLVLHLRDLVDGFLKDAILRAVKEAGFEVSDDDVVVVGGFPYAYIPDPSVVPELRALYEQLA